MANGYESQRVGSRSGGGMTELMQLLKMFQGDPRADERKIAKKSSNLESLIKITNDISSMDSLGSRIKEADLSFDDMGDDERKRCGKLGHEFVMSDDASMSATAMSNLFIEHMDTAFEKWTPRKRFTMFKA